MDTCFLAFVTYQPLHHPFAFQSRNLRNQTIESFFPFTTKFSVAWIVKKKKFLFKSAYFLLTSLFFSLSVFVTLLKPLVELVVTQQKGYIDSGTFLKRLLRHGHIARAFSYGSAIICFGPVSAVTDFFFFLDLKKPRLPITQPVQHRSLMQTKYFHCQFAASICLHYYYY